MRRAVRKSTPQVTGRLESDSKAMAPTTVVSVSDWANSSGHLSALQGLESHWQLQSLGRYFRGCPIAQCWPEHLCAGVGLTRWQRAHYFFQKQSLKMNGHGLAPVSIKVCDWNDKSFRWLAGLGPLSPQAQKLLALTSPGPE